ncbi:MAG: hypothetical protein RLZ98_56 [Pseudomonadota bacterium]
MAKTNLTAALAALGCMAGLLPSMAAAQSVGDFYKGKTLTFRVGYGAGGGYDTTARIAARHMGKHIPGNPTVTVDNMPGAGSLRALINMYNVGAKDGTLIVLAASSAALEPLIGNPAAKFDVRKINWIGSLHQDINSCSVWNGAGQGIKSFEDLLKAKQEIVFGSTGPQAITTKWPLFIKNVFNVPIKVLEGYKGSKAIMLAMPRGEVHAICGMFESSARGSYMSELKSGDLKVLLQTGMKNKSKLFGDAPQIGELVKDKGKEVEQIMRYVFSPAEITRPVSAPPGVPEDRVAALRKALLDTMKDPEVVATGAKLNIEWQPMSGEDLKAAIFDLYDTPKAVIEKATKLTTVN